MVLPSNADRLREQFAASADGDAAVATILEEACRIADRLDQIHAFESGKSDWVEVLRFRMGDGEDGVIHVSIDAVLSEARQQANTLRQLVGMLMKADPAVKSAPVVDGENVSPIDAARARREARMKKA